MITGKGWELYIKRFCEQCRGARTRTAGHYQVFHNGVATEITGMMVESRGPGDNVVQGSGKCIEAGVYPLATQAGERYKTYDYVRGDVRARPQPGFEVLSTGNRKEILVHPGAGFLKSIGCLNPTSNMITGDNNMDFAASRWRVIAMIEDMKKFLDDKFPKKNGYPIPGASIVIEE